MKDDADEDNTSAVFLVARNRFEVEKRVGDGKNKVEKWIRERVQTFKLGTKGERDERMVE